MSRSILIAISVFLTCAVTAFGQEIDTLNVASSDTTQVDQAVDKERKRHSPKLATILSAVAPGAGQIYNRKYWKLPIIYGAFGGLIYSVVWHNQQFRTFKDAYLIRIDDDPATVDQFEGQYSEDNLLSLQADYRKNRDLSAIFLGVVYALNIVDAVVDAHLFDFDVGEDLSMKIQPKVEPIPFQPTPSVGVGVSLRLR
jgi:hypothetical protein